MVRRRILIPLFVVSLALALGTLGYILIEGWRPLDSFWMAAISLTTAGFGEVHPLSPTGRIYTIVLMLAGMGVLAYGISVVTGFVVEGELRDFLRRRTMRKQISKMRGHTIVCGAGRTGLHVVAELRKVREKFVVIEGHHDVADELRREGSAVIEGDATHEEVLKEAGIDTAARMVVSLTDDKDNLFVVMTAHGINPKMRIVARYVNDRSAEKLKKAGASAVVSPNAIGGLRMASEALRPAVVSFLDVMLRSSKATLRIEEAHVHEGSKLSGKHLRDAKISEHTGLLVLALRGKDGHPHFNPAPATQLLPGTTLVVMGELDGVKKLKALAGEVNSRN